MSTTSPASSTCSPGGAVRRSAPHAPTRMQQRRRPRPESNRRRTRGRAGAPPGEQGSGTARQRRRPCRPREPAGPPPARAAGRAAINAPTPARTGRASRRAGRSSRCQRDPDFDERVSLEEVPGVEILEQKTPGETLTGNVPYTAAWDRKGRAASERSPRSAIPARRRTSEQRRDTRRILPQRVRASSAQGGRGASRPRSRASQFGSLAWRKTARRSASRSRLPRVAAPVWGGRSCSHPG